ncbi:hypothetical protein GCM10023198_10580 [Promicromonospora umidemergens]|uniref:Uncharacterized protein n=1 Tax=Promicromonospora umidemergens TaxID=629679 RepID=A0ABP8WSD3_9MICO
MTRAVTPLEMAARVEFAKAIYVHAGATPIPVHNAGHSSLTRQADGTFTSPSGLVYGCPNLDQGLLRPLIADQGSAILFCDRAECVWLHPDDMSFSEAIYPQGPDWEVVPGVHVTPGKTRWARPQDLPSGWTDGYDWHEG